jgi:hypothetical protein
MKDEKYRHFYYWENQIKNSKDLMRNPFENLPIINGGVDDVLDMAERATKIENSFPIFERCLSPFNKKTVPIFVGNLTPYKD